MSYPAFTPITALWPVLISVREANSQAIELQVQRLNHYTTEQPGVKALKG